MTRAAHAAATDCIKKLQEIAAKTKGGNPEAYKVAGGKVSGPGGTMTFAQAAQKAIELGGKYDGHEVPEDVNAFTKNSLKALAGQGLIAVARDAYPRDGQSQSYVVGFAEVEVDTETGVVKVLDYTAMGDVGTILNPRSLKGQLFGGSMLGLGHAADAALGLRPAVRRRAGAALLSEQAADDSGRAAPLRGRRGQHSGSGDADGCARRRRTAGRRGVRRDHDGDHGCGRRRGLPQVARVAGHPSGSARERREANARSVDRASLGIRESGFGIRIRLGIR